MPEMLNFELPKYQSSIIKVIGVGGGGSNAVNHMYHQGITGVDFIVCNTDAQALDKSPVPTKIQLGSKGLGAGSIPSVGREAANENLDSIREILENNTEMVFITAGMGGGTGTGAAPVIAALAKELGILTVGIVTLPFSFEGRKRGLQAKAGIDELRKSVDSLLIICNDKLRELDGDLTLKEAFAKADNILTVAAKGIAEIITVTGYVNVDFRDIRTVMKDSGKAIMGAGIAEGENRALQAVQMALSSPLLDDVNIRGASNILLYMASGTQDITMDEVMEITDYIQHEAGSTADVIWGNGVNEELGAKISITVIATGFDSTAITPPKPKDITVHTLEDVKKPEPVEPKAAEIESITLIKRSPEQVKSQVATDMEKRIADQQRSFSFAVPTPELPATPTVDPQPVKPELKIEAPKPTGFDFLRKNTPDRSQQTEKEEKMQAELAQKRLDQLRELSIKIGTPEGLEEMERTPAYKRKNIELKDAVPSSGSEISRSSIFKNTDNTVELRQNNSFLHDNVD